LSSRFRWNLESNRLAQLLREKRRAGARILDLTESNPTRAGFSYPAQEILEGLANPATLTYEPEPRGLLSARQTIADYYRERGLPVLPDRVHLTSSTSEAYSFLFKLLADIGDEVLVPQPSYPLFEFLAALEGVELRPYHLIYGHPAGWRIDFDSLESAITGRARAVIAVNPNNPTGSFIAPDERDRLVRLCAENNLALIVDEVFGDYSWREGEQDSSSCVTSETSLTFVLSGLSKVLGLPQMKLSWIVAGGPARLLCPAQERLDLIADTYLSVGSPPQHASAAWLRLRGGLRRQILDRVLGNLSLLRGVVEGSSCRLLTAEGGWYATIEIPRHVSEEDWVLTLLGEDDVLVHPGYFFDFAREAYLVLSLLPEPQIFGEAVERMLARIGQ